MGFENPIADVDDVNVLLDDDVAREHAIVNPISQAAFIGRRGGPLRTVNIASQIVGFAADDFSDGSSVNAANHFDERRANSNFKIKIEAKFSYGAVFDV